MSIIVIYPSPESKTKELGIKNWPIPTYEVSFSIENIKRKRIIYFLKAK